MMLPTRYNADIGLYVFNSNHWSVDGALKIVHYTLASFKPWSWWCGWLIEEQARWNVRPLHPWQLCTHLVALALAALWALWEHFCLSICAISTVLSIHTLAMWFLTGNMLQKHRMRLGPDVYGRRHGITLMQAFAQSWMPLLPPLLAVLIGRGLTLGWPSYILPIVRWVPPMQPRSPSPLLGLAAGYGSLALSVLLAVTLIPAYVRPFNPSMPCVCPHDPCSLG